MQGTEVEFAVTDQDGRAVKTLPTGTNVFFTYAKLVSDAAQNTQWTSYINREESTANPPNNTGPGGTPVLALALQANRQTATAALVNLGNGRYRYTFTSSGLTTTNLLTAPVPYASNLTNRIAIQVSGGGLIPVNRAHDFIPAGGVVSVTRNIATTASCLECHESNFGFHDSSARVEVVYCVTCHNPGTTDANSGLSLDMASMIHSIHSGPNLANSPYIIWGFGGSEHDYSGVGYPQDRRNCRKCHTGDDAATVNGNNWKTRPTRIACGACHDDVNFATGVNHDGGALSDDTACTACHSSTDIERYHLTTYPSPNNPSVHAGLVNFTYQITSVTTVNVLQGSTTNTLPVVTFRIQLNGADMDLSETVSSETGLPAGISSGPSFLVAYTSPQDGIAAPADWNQRGRSAAQPASVSLANVRNGTQGSITANGDGTYTATLRGTVSGEVYSAAYPAAATRRGVALQGTFAQSEASAGSDINGDGDTADSIPRNTKSVIRGVTGDSARRVVVDNNKCLACHETLQLHGGSRVDETAVCIVCHNPNLTSSGRGADPATVLARMSAEDEAAMTANGYDPANPLTFPEASNNFKNMIHGIHASHFRTTRFDFVRDRGAAGVFYYDWSHVTYPSDVVNCEMCHIAGTYDIDLPAGVLATNDITYGANRTEILARRASVPNGTDRIISQSAASCVSCHDGALSIAHMKHNGGYFGDRISYNTTETCVICHGPGRSADVTVVHGR